MKIVSDSFSDWPEYKIYNWSSFTPYRGGAGEVVLHNKAGDAVVLRLDWPSAGTLAMTLMGTLISAQSHRHRHKLNGGERCIRCGLHIDNIRAGVETIALRTIKRKERRS